MSSAIAMSSTPITISIADKQESIIRKVIKRATRHPGCRRYFQKYIINTIQSDLLIDPTYLNKGHVINDFHQNLPVYLFHLYEEKYRGKNHDDDSIFNLFPFIKQLRDQFEECIRFKEGISTGFHLGPTISDAIEKYWAKYIATRVNFVEPKAVIYYRNQFGYLPYLQSTFWDGQKCVKCTNTLTAKPGDSIYLYSCCQTIVCRDCSNYDPTETSCPFCCYQNIYTCSNDRQTPKYGNNLY